MKRFAALCLCLLMAALAACGVSEAPVSGSSPAPDGASPSPAAQRRVMVRFDPVSETVTGADGAVLPQLRLPPRHGDRIRFRRGAGDFLGNQRRAHAAAGGA